MTNTEPSKELDKRLDEILRLYIGNYETVDSYEKSINEAKQTIKQLMVDEFIKLIGDDEDDYQNPDYEIPHTSGYSNLTLAEILVAHAEGWDDCKQTLRDKLQEWINE